MKVVFVEGALDDLTEEEIAELNAEIDRNIEDGSFFDESTPVDFNTLEKEEPELYEKLMQQIEKLPVEGSSMED